MRSSDQEVDEEDADFEVEVKAKTEKAMLVEYDEEDCWIPISLISGGSTIDENSDVGDFGEIAIPQWKAKQLGWE